MIILSSFIKYFLIKISLSFLAKDVWPIDTVK